MYGLLVSKELSISPLGTFPKKKILINLVYSFHSHHKTSGKLKEISYNFIKSKSRKQEKNQELALHMNMIIPTQYPTTSSKRENANYKQEILMGKKKKKQIEPSRQYHHRRRRCHRRRRREKLIEQKTEEWKPHLKRWDFGSTPFH